MLSENKKQNVTYHTKQLCPAYGNSCKKKKNNHIDMASWKIDGETMETVTEFILRGSKITAVCDCSHETKRCLLRGRKAMKNLDSILKSRDVTLSTKMHIVKAMVSPVVMDGCES